MLVRVKGQTLAAMQTPGKVTRNSHNASLLVLTQKKPLSVVCLCTRQGWGTQECECDGSKRQYVFFCFLCRSTALSEWSSRPVQLFAFTMHEHTSSQVPGKLNWTNSSVHFNKVYGIISEPWNNPSAAVFTFPCGAPAFSVSLLFYLPAHRALN